MGSWLTEVTRFQIISSGSAEFRGGDLDQQTECFGHQGWLHKGAPQSNPLISPSLRLCLKLRGPSTSLAAGKLGRAF